jgi:HCOMODA/2-hydroxy-3-carboxy-muconic semialdehyde decarboxylase
MAAGPGSEFGFVGEPIGDTQRRVRLAARALARHNLVHAYGHVSARLDDNRFLVCAPKPMGLIGEGEDGDIVLIDGALPDNVLGEVRCHQRIYAARPDVNGVCRVFPRNVLTLSTFQRTPKARIGFGAYFHPQPPLWDDPLLIRSDEQAIAFAARLGDARAIVMRGNGAVCVGPSVEESIVMAFYLEESAGTELAVMAAGDTANAVCFTDEQAAVRATGTGRIYERLWEYMTAGDPEVQG